MEALYSRALLEWPLVLASAATFGTATFVLAVRGFDGGPAGSIVAALLPAWRLMAIAIFLVSPIMVLKLTAEMSGLSWREALPLVPEVMTQTHSGEVWRWALIVAALLLVSVFAPLASTARAVALACFSAVLMFCEAQLSHAVDHGSMAVLIDLVHETAAGSWIGALLGLWLVTRLAQPPSNWIASAARVVSTIAVWSVAALVLSGAYTAYQGLGLSFDRLLFSSYGRTLIIKVVVFCAVLSIGAYNRERLMPDVAASATQRTLLRNAGIEALVLGGVVVGLAALLANTPPARGHMMSHPGMAMDTLDLPGPGNRRASTEWKP
jgi:putative copper resistance protein D